MDRSRKPCIGVFDSGIGGLSVLKECIRLAPSVRYLYYGDNARAPYGSRTEEEIVRFVREGLSALGAEGVDAAVLACNTATAVAVEEMRREFPFPVVGVEPAVKQAAETHHSALVLCTPRTAGSARLSALLSRFPACSFEVAPLPGLAIAIERALTAGEPLDLSAHLPATQAECVVLGCTHYALVSEKISAHYGVPVFDGAAGTAKHVLELLKIGHENHFRPRHDPRQKGGICVEFLGNSKNINEIAYKTNICFQ